MRPRTVWSTAKPIACLAGRRSLRRLPRGAGAARRRPTGCCRRFDSAPGRVVQPRGILARNDPRVRLLEGLEQHVEVLSGDGARRDRGARRRASPTTSIRTTGRRRACFSISARTASPRPRYARGRALDAFSYNGGFALALAPRCDEVVAVDISEDAVARIAANAARNGSTNVEARAMNVFDELRELERGASGSTRSCSTRRRSRRTRRRCRRRCRATRRSTCAR